MKLLRIFSSCRRIFSPKSLFLHATSPHSCCQPLCIAPSRLYSTQTVSTSAPRDTTTKFIAQNPLETFQTNMSAELLEMMQATPTVNAHYDGSENDRVQLLRKAGDAIFSHYNNAKYAQALRVYSELYIDCLAPTDPIHNFALASLIYASHPMEWKKDIGVQRRNSILNFYFSMISQQKKLTVVGLNSLLMMDGVFNQFPEEAFEFFQHVHQFINPAKKNPQDGSPKNLSSVNLSGANEGSSDLEKELQHFGKVKLNSATFSILAKCCCLMSQDSSQKALFLLETMKSYQILPSSEFFFNFCQALSLEGKSKEALEIYLQEKNSFSSSLDFHILSNLLSHLIFQEDVETSKKVLFLFLDHKIPPEIGLASGLSDLAYRKNCLSLAQLLKTCMDNYRIDSHGLIEESLFKIFLSHFKFDQAVKLLKPSNSWSFSSTKHILSSFFQTPNDLSLFLATLEHHPQFCTTLFLDSLLYCSAVKLQSSPLVSRLKNAYRQFYLPTSEETYRILFHHFIQSKNDSSLDEAFYDYTEEFVLPSQEMAELYLNFLLERHSHQKAHTCLKTFHEWGVQISFDLVEKTKSLQDEHSLPHL